MAPEVCLKGKYARKTRQCGLVMTLFLIGASLAGCSDPAIPVGTVGHVQKYFGGIAADEPLAVLVGRDVLSAGGTAADAVVAMSLTMMVTRPDAAGPGGGGVCVVYSAKDNKAEVIEFMPYAARTRSPAGQWIATVPGSFRGLFALSARYGALRWEQLILPAENMARFGVEMPRSLARNLISDGSALLADPRARLSFADGGGKPLAEGALFRQLDLAGLLGRMRSIGPGDLYSGQFARQYLDAVLAAGGWLEIDDLRDYRPAWRATVELKAGNHILHLPPSPALGAVVAGRIWRDLGNSSRYSGADGAGQASMMAESAREAHAAALAPPGSGRGSAGAIAIDSSGSAASCVLTMGRPFGSGRVMGDTGIIAVEPASSASALLLAPSVLANKNLKTAYAAAASSDDRYAGAALVTVYAHLLDGDRTMEEAMNAPRYAAGRAAGEIVVESRSPPEVRAALSSGGRTVTVTSTIGRVNIMYCPVGMLERPDLCAVRTDPRGFGHAVNAEF